MRHAESTLRVDADVRALADSQFRFVAGVAGDGTEIIQSVNLPDRYVRVVDGAVRLDLVGTSFRRVPRTAGVSIQLPTGEFLTHDQGRLTAGPADGPRTRFLLS
ncbi:AbfB domain-containing protein [Micromonospora sp. CPCC 206061]|uniref:AbfB domain-containing protein n=1 Tax=Micromonospora sp. CPCC 206061 TaxID=3122410 RepID=UPI002FF16D87